MFFFRSPSPKHHCQKGSGAGRRPAAHPRPQLEQLEDRLTPSTTMSFVDSQWADLSRTSGSPQIGDIVQNLNDAMNPGSVTAIYGVTGFGTLTTGASGTAPGAATINNAIANTIAGGTVDVLDGTYNEEVVISKSLTLEGAQAGVDPAPAFPRSSRSLPAAAPCAH